MKKAFFIPNRFPVAHVGLSPVLYKALLMLVFPSSGVQLNLKRLARFFSEMAFLPNHLLASR